jgi:transcriptional regulator with PAS, ATPase and Fis domain
MISQRMVKRAENIEVPFLALNAITELREELEDLEKLAVDSARDKGASWDSLAEALGITRQALQQRVQRRQTLRVTHEQDPAAKANR